MDLITILKTENASKWNIYYDIKYHKLNTNKYEQNYLNIKLKIEREHRLYHDMYMFKECWSRWFKTLDDYYKVYPPK